ncbi:MAG: Ig-like domain-containing protein [Bacteroidota bacterium]
MFRLNSSGGGAVDTYSFTVGNNGADAIKKIVISIPSGFSGITESVTTCPTNWYKLVSSTEIKCTDADGGNEINSENSAIAENVILAPNPGSDTSYPWTPVTTDVNGGTQSNAPTITVDVTAPIVTITPLTPDPTNDNTPSFSGMATDTTTNIVEIKYQVDSGEWQTVDSFTSSKSVSYTFTTSVLSDGSHNVYVKAKDEVGNEVISANYATDGFTVDTAKPTTSDNAPSGWQTTSPVVTITLTPSDPSPSSGIAWTKYCTNIDNTCDPTSGTDYTIPVGISAEGATYFRYASKDVAGNIQDTVSRKVEIDTVAPQITSPAGDKSITTGESVTISVTASDDTSGITSAKIYLDGDTVETDMTKSGDTYTYVFNAPLNSIASHAYYIIVKDVAGLETRDPVGTYAITVTDNDAPVFGIDATPTSATTGDSFTFSVPVSDNIGVSLVDVEYWYGSGTRTTEAMGLNAGKYEKQIIIPSDKLDLLRYIFHAKDAVTNHQETTQKDVAVTDNDAPTAPGTPTHTDDANAGYDNDNTLDFSWTAASDNIGVVGYKVYVWDSTSQTYDTGTNVGNVLTYALTGVNGLSYKIKVSALDAAGNEGLTAESSTVTVDTVAPISSISINPLSPVKAGNIAVTLTTSESVPNAPSLTYTPNGKTAVSVTLTGSGTTWTDTMTITDSTGDGTATFSYSGTDAAGNIGTTITSGQTFVIDTTVPTMVSAETQDTNGNGKINEIIVAFSEDLKGSTVQASDFNVAGYSVTGASENNGVVTLTLTEGTNYDTGAKPVVSIAAGGSIEDIAGNAITLGSITPTDKAKPVMVSATTTSTTTIDVTFSEDLNGVSISENDFTIAGYTILSASEVNGVITLTTTSAFGTGDTPQVSVVVHGVEDHLSGNWNDAKSITPTDGIKPVVSSAVYPSLTKAGSVTFTITFSENMDNSVAPVVTYDPQGAGNGAAAQTITQTSYSGNTWVGTATIPSGQSANYDGTAVISISGANDVAGNTMDADVTHTFVIDTSAPSSPDAAKMAVTMNPPGTQDTISGSNGAVEANAVVNIYKDVALGETNKIGTANADSNGAFGPINIGDNQYGTVYVTATDAAGNEGPTTTMQNDIVAPAAPIITQPTTPTNSQPITVSGSAEAGSTVEVFVNGVSKGTITATPEGSFILSGVALAEGTNTIVAKATDAAGNPSELSDAVTAVLDTGLPTVSIDSVLPKVAVDVTDYIKGTVTISATAQDNIGGTGISKVEFYYGTTKIGEDATSSYSVEWNTIGLADGAYSLTAVAVDNAGNSKTSTPVSVTVDNAGPAIGTIAITPSYTTGGNTYVPATSTVEASVNDNTGSGVAGCEYTVDGGTNWVIATYASGKCTKSAADTSSASSINMRATDALGNLGTGNAIPVIPDTQAPIAYNFVPANDGFTNDATPTISVDITDVPSGVDGSTITMTVGGATVTPAKTSITSGYHIEYTPTTQFADATSVAVSVSAKDNSGNPMSATTWTFTVDLTAPSIISRTPGINAVGINPSSSIVVKFSEPVIISSGNVALTSGTSVTTTVEYDSTTNTATIKPTTTLYSNKGYTITLSGVVDKAGNLLPTSTWSFTTATYYNISLTKGLNLISLPIVPTNKNIENVIENEEENIDTVWTYDAINDKWKMYAPNGPSNDLFDMTAGNGYWISYTKDTAGKLDGWGNLFLEGANTPPQSTLTSGWNLIGYYQRENTDGLAASCALKTLRDPDSATSQWWTMLMGYDNGNKQFSNVGFSDNMNPGQGYWIFMTSKLNTYKYGPGLSDSECVV